MATRQATRSTAPLHDAATVFARAGVDFDLVADVAEQRNSHFETGGQFGGLQNLAGRIALDGGFRVVDDAHHVGGQFDRNAARSEERRVGKGRKAAQVRSLMENKESQMSMHA